MQAHPSFPLSVRRSARPVRWLGCIGLLTLLSLAPDTGAQPGLTGAAPATVLRVHARNLDVTLNAVRSYLPIPLKSEALLDDLLGSMGRQVALSAPVDVVVALDTQSVEVPLPPLWTVAFGVRSREETRRVLANSLVGAELKGGLSRYRVTAGGDTWHCVLGPGGAGSDGRMGCSLNERNRDELGAYAVALPPLSLKSDLRAELSVETLTRTYDASWQRALQMVGLLLPQKLQLGDPEFDRSLTDLTQTLVAQVGATARDLRSISLELSLDGTGATARLAYQMAGQGSWWGQADAETAARTDGGPPPLFFTLPKGSTAASYATTNAKYAMRFLNLLSPLLDAYLMHDKLAAADRQALVDVVNGLTALDGPTATVVAELATPRPAAVPGKAERGDLSALLGGAVYLVSGDGGATGGAERWMAWLKSLATAYNRPGVQSYLRGKAKQLGMSEPLPTLRLQPAPKALGAGAMAMVVTITPPAGAFGGGKAPAHAGSPAGGHPVAKAKATPLTFHVLSAVAGGRTWMAAGTDPAAVLAQLQAQLARPETETLAVRTGLDVLRQPGLRGGGFTSLVSLGRYVDGLLSLSKGRGGRSERPQSTAQLFSMIPHHGEVPMVYTSRVTRAGAGDTVGEFAVQVPRMGIEDLVAVVMTLAM